MRKEKILIVDDNDINLKFIASILKAKHYRVRALSNGLKLFEALESSKPDLILLDIMMPDKSGYELCSSLKHDKRFSEIPVIFLTSLNDSASIMKCFNVGAADYLSKPVNPQELFARIETHLNLKINMEKLQEAYRELDVFNHMISHDLKSPILMVNKLAGYLEDYKEKIDNPDYEEIVSGIRQKTEEVVYIMEKYSELSKLCCTKPSIEPIALNDLFKEIFMENTFSAQAVIKIADMPVIYGDRLLMKCAFANIVSNALKFSHNRHPSIVEVGYNKLENGTLIFVKDNGVGFNMKYSANIFEMFTRLHSQKDFEGTGTGLAIVKKIVMLHGGKVWIEAAENEGATVYMELPYLL